MGHTGLTLVCTIAILAVIPAMSVQYREFLDRTGLRSSIGLTILVSVGSFLLWLLISFFVPNVSSSPLEYPTAALSAVSGFLASLTVRDTTPRALPPVLFSFVWTVVVFAPVALVVLFPTEVGIPITAGPLDLGGALPVQIAVGAGALVVLTVARRWSVEDRSHIRPRWWLQFACGLVIWAGWLFGFVGLELQVDSVVTPRIIVNSIVAPLCAIVGWLIGQRIVSATTTATGAVAGMLCGVVAISAGSAYLEPLWAGVTGAVAGLACSVFVYRRIAKTGRHAWFLVGVHLLAGAVGLVAIGLFGDSIGFIYDGQPSLVQVQLESMLAVIVWAALISLLLWLVVRRLARRESEAARPARP